MTTTTTTAPAQTTPSRHTLLTTGPVWRVGAVAGTTAAAVVLYAYGSAASALSVPMNTCARAAGSKRRG